MDANTSKLIAAGVLLVTWVSMIFAKAYIPQLDTTVLIGTIQASLTGLGLHAVISKSTPTESKQ